MSIESERVRRARRAFDRKVPRRGGSCERCGVNRRILHRDHIRPKWMGGSNEDDNIQYLCANCHEDKTHFEDPKRIPFESKAMRDLRALSVRIFVDSLPPPPIESPRRIPGVDYDPTPFETLD